jgi:hypothetical protein
LFASDGFAGSTGASPAGATDPEAELLTGAVFAFPSAAGAVLALASTGVVDAGASSTGASGFAESTEILPVSAGIARKRAESINVVAATMVIFDNTVAVPRGARAELETLLVNNAPASVLPGWRSTAATKIMHETKNIV